MKNEAPGDASLKKQAETVLLAEDDDSVRAFVTRVLHGSGYAVIAARDGAEALQLFDEGSESVAIAVLDVAMPKMNGRLVAERIRARHPSLPVLFCTGYDFKLLENGFVLDSAMAILKKPFSHADLLRAIRDLIDGHYGAAHQ